MELCIYSFKKHVLSTYEVTRTEDLETNKQSKTVLAFKERVLPSRGEASPQRSKLLCGFVEAMLGVLEGTKVHREVNFPLRVQGNLRQRCDI